MLHIIVYNAGMDKNKQTQKRPKYRVWGTVPAEVGDSLEYWYVKLGIPKTSLVAMSIQAGLKAIIRGIAPEEAFSPEQWQKILDIKNKKDGGIEKTT
jgi:hypothetical protein